MKKIISLLIAVIMLISMVPAMAETTTASDSEEIGLLRALGIFENDISAENTVTRGEFAVYAARMLGIGTDGYVDKRYFKDVPSSLREAGAINAMNERGLMIGTGNYEFAPNEPIEPMHAAIILLKIAGYPQVYIDNNRAPMREVIGNISGNTVNDVELAYMIYNALSLPYFTLTGITDGDAEFDVDEDYLVLEELFGVYCVSGRVTAAEGAGINSYGAPSYDTIVIGDRIFRNTDVDAYGFIGMYVNAYIKNTEAEGMDTLVFLWDDSYDVIEITADELVSVTGNYDVKYTENDGSKTKNVSLPSNVRVVRNGALVKDDVLGTLNIKNGSMKLIKNDKSVYDVVIVADYKTALVTAVSQDGSLIYTKNSAPIDLSKTAIQRIKVYNGDGEESSVANIKSGSFISYFESEVNVEIHISGSMLSGKVEALSETDVPKVKISGTEAEVDKAYYEANKAKFSVGREGNFYLDFDNRIAYAEGKGGDGSFAYILGVSLVEFSDTLKVKVYDQSGAVTVYENGGNKIEVDGVKLSGKEAYAKLTRDGGVINQPVRYLLDSSGSIRMIDTPTYNASAESENSLKKTVDSQKLIYLASSKSMGVILPVGARTVVMQMPTENGKPSENEKDYAINPTFTGYNEYLVEAYSANRDSIFPDIILTGMVQREESRSCIFDSVSDNLTSDGDIVKTIKIGSQNGIENLNIVSDFAVSDADRADGYVSWDALGEGDIIKVIQNGRGEVVKIKLVFDYDKDEQIRTDRLTAYGHYETYDTESFGYVKKIEEGYYKYGPLNDDSKDEILKLSGASIIVFDSSRRTDKVYVGSEKDITTVESVGENASVILTNQRSGLSQHTIVFKNGADAFKAK